MRQAKVEGCLGDIAVADPRVAAVAARRQGSGIPPGRRRPTPAARVRPGRSPARPRRAPNGGRVVFPAPAQPGTMMRRVGIAILDEGFDRATYQAHDRTAPAPRHARRPAAHPPGAERHRGEPAAGSFAGDRRGGRLVLGRGDFPGLRGRRRRAGFRLRQPPDRLCVGAVRHRWRAPARPWLGAAGCGDGAIATGRAPAGVPDHRPGHQGRGLLPVAGLATDRGKHARRNGVRL